MARPRTPSNVLQLRGAFAKDPARGRARADEPVVTEGIGQPPEHLADPQRKAWLEIVGNAHEGVLGKADRIAVELAAQLLAEFRENPLEFTAARMARLDSLLGRFGMTPADRSKVSAPKGGTTKTNPFAELMTRGKKKA